MNPHMLPNFQSCSDILMQNYVLISLMKIFKHIADNMCIMFYINRESCQKYM